MILLGLCLALPLPHATSCPEAQDAGPRVPDGFQVEAATRAGALSAPQAFAFDGRGRLFVVDRARTDTGPARVLLFVDRDLDGVFEDERTLLEHAGTLGALAVAPGGLWTARDDGLVHVPLDEADTPGPARVVAAARAAGGGPRALAFGPDGWLYASGGACGPEGAAVWRVHPVGLEVEPFAFGPQPCAALAFDEAGNLFGFEARGSRLRQVVPGALLGPAQEDPIEPVEFEPAPGFAAVGATFELGGRVPAELRSELLVCDRGRVARLALEARGSGFRAEERGERVSAGQGEFAPRALCGGPDGSLYVLGEGGAAGGRVWRVSYGPARAEAVDVGRLSNSELVARVLDRNEWWVRRSLLELGGRGARGETHAWLRSVLRHNSDPLRRVRALRALAACEGLDEDLRLSILRDRHPRLQAWGTRLVLDRGEFGERFAASLVGLAARTGSIEVRLQLAAALGEVSDETAWTLAAQLVGRASDADDPNIPSLLAHGVARLVPQDGGRALGLVRVARIPLVVQSLFEGLARDPAQHEALVQHLVLDTDPRRELAALRGFVAGLPGAAPIERPPSWTVLENRLGGRDSPEVQRLADILSQAFGGDPGDGHR